MTRFPVNTQHFTVTDDQGKIIAAQVRKKNSNINTICFLYLHAQVVEVTNSTANIRGVNGSLYELVITVS